MILRRMLIVLLFLAVLRICGADMSLTENGKSRYSVKLCSKATDTDRLALKELQEVFYALTSAALPEYKGKGPVIFIGERPAGEKTLAEGEHVTRSVDGDIYLYGEGKWGNLYAVYAFIEDQLGGRYYNLDEGLFLREKSKKTLSPFDRRYKLSFQYRKLSPLAPRYNESFACRNRENVHLRNAFGIRRDLSYLTIACHSFYYFIPPGGSRVVGSNPNPKKTGYFATHPEFFSLDKNGKRVKTQLCFSNKELRKELLRNMKEAIREKLPENTGMKKLVVDLSANDSGGLLCHCGDCIALNRKYECPAGAFFECLVELCEAIGKEYPQVTISTLLYRKEQTQKPPVGLTFPKNFEGRFAPIDNNFLGSFSDAGNAETRRDLEQWSRISKPSIWYYSSHYSTMYHTVRGCPPPPLGHAERIAADLKLFSKLGIDDIYIEHDSGTACNANFSDMLAWVMYRLLRDVDQDVHMLVKEYMDDNYGAAAPAMLRYYRELEAIRKKLLSDGVHFNYMPRNGQYASYMTPANIMRWQNEFDAMERAVGNDEKMLLRIRQARLSLDIETLTNFRKITARKTDFPLRYADIRARTLDTVERSNASRIPDELYISYRLNLLPMLAELEHQPKALPKEFAAIPEDNIISLNPDSPRRLRASVKVNDPDAAWGIAGCEEIPPGKTTYSISFYDYWNKKVQAERKIDLNGVKDGYHFYKLGTVVPTQNCLFATEKWVVTVPADHVYSFDEPELKYDAYMSLKFLTSADGKKQVLCDRVILVRNDR